MRVMEDRPCGGRELLSAIRVPADVKPQTAVRPLCPVLIAVLGTLLGVVLRTRVLLHILVSASGAAHDTVRPAHLFDVGKALLVSGELLMGFTDVHRIILARRYRSAAVTAKPKTMNVAV